MVDDAVWDLGGGTGMLVLLLKVVSGISSEVARVAILALDSLGLFGE